MIRTSLFFFLESAPRSKNKFSQSDFGHYFEKNTAKNIASIENLRQNKLIYILFLLFFKINKKQKIEPQRKKSSF